MANSADACPGCGDAATAPKAAHSGFRGVKLVRLRRGGVPTHGLCFALPKNLGPGVTGAHFPFYACRRRSIDAVIFAPKKQQIPLQRDGVVPLPSARAACSQNPARPRVRRAYFAVLRALLSRCRSECGAQLFGSCLCPLPFHGLSRFLQLTLIAEGESILDRQDGVLETAVALETVPVMISVRSVRMSPCSSSAATYFATVLTEMPSFLAMAG